MNTKVIHITKPSDKLLQLVRILKAEKDEKLRAVKIKQETTAKQK